MTQLKTAYDSYRISLILFVLLYFATWKQSKTCHMCWVSQPLRCSRYSQFNNNKRNLFKWAFGDEVEARVQKLIHIHFTLSIIEWVYNWLWHFPPYNILISRSIAGKSFATFVNDNMPKCVGRRFKTLPMTSIATCGGQRTEAIAILPIWEIFDLSRVRLWLGAIKSVSEMVVITIFAPQTPRSPHTCEFYL